MTEQHACTFVESGRYLGPCSICGMPASDGMRKLAGDTMRRLLVDFLNERDSIVASMGNDVTNPDWHTANGNAEARRVLADRFEQADIDPGWVPTMQDLTPIPAGPRNAALVRAEHVLETIEMGGAKYSSCKADGYITDNLATNPCPTLAALNRTDPPPVPPVFSIWQVQLSVASAVAAAVAVGVKSTTQAMVYARDNAEAIREIFLGSLRITEPPPEFIDPVMDERLLARAIHAALCNSFDAHNVTIASDLLLVEAHHAAQQINQGGVKMVDLAAGDLFEAIVDAISRPNQYATRDGHAVPGHQARAVVEVLRRAAK